LIASLGLVALILVAGVRVSTTIFRFAIDFLSVLSHVASLNVIWISGVGRSSVVDLEDMFKDARGFHW